MKDLKYSVLLENLIEQVPAFHLLLTEDQILSFWEKAILFNFHTLGRGGIHKFVNTHTNFVT